MKDESKSSKTLRGFLRFTLSTRGLTINDLATMHGMPGSSLCVAFYRAFPKAEKIIANALDLQPWDLWPGRYDENQRPNRCNSWYRRKSGGWKPKITQKNLQSRKDLNEGVKV